MQSDKVILSRLFTDYSEYEACKENAQAWLIDNVADFDRREIDSWDNLNRYWELSSRDTYPNGVIFSFGKNDSWKMVEVNDITIKPNLTQSRFVYTYELFVILEWSPAVLQLKLAYF